MYVSQNNLIKCAMNHTCRDSQIPYIHYFQSFWPLLQCQLHLKNKWKRFQNFDEHDVSSAKSMRCAYNQKTKLREKCRALPSVIALTKMVEARIKMIRDALPNRRISFLTTCCPTKAAIVATRVKYRAVQNSKK